MSPKLLSSRFLASLSLPPYVTNNRIMINLILKTIPFIPFFFYHTPLLGSLSLLRPVRGFRGCSKLCSTLSWNCSNYALNILFTSLIKAFIINFMSIPPVTPSDASLFDILLQKTRLEKKIKISQITHSRVFTQRIIHSVRWCFHTIYLAFSHSNVLSTLAFCHL